MQSHWKNKEESNKKDAIMPLAMRSYYNGKKFGDNYWSLDDEAGVHQYFYHDKKSRNGYRYAGTRMVKGNMEVADGFTKILHNTDTWDPYAPNGRNHHKHPRHALPPPEKDKGENLMAPERREEITKGATGSPIDSDDESKMIKAYLVVDEEDKDGVRAVEMHS
jgi:hypothetical protein